MNAGDPTRAPVRVTWDSSSTRAMPKSINFTHPVPSIMMFSGLMSRWMMPLPWAQISAVQIWMPISAAGSLGIRWTSSTNSLSVGPLMNSVMMKHCSASGPEKS